MKTVTDAMRIFEVDVSGSQSRGVLESHVVLAETLEGAIRTALADMGDDGGFGEELRISQARELHGRFLVEDAS